MFKANWGLYQSNPGPQNFTNPLQSTAYTFAWNDRNEDRQFTLDEVGNFVSSTGGTRNTISPDLAQEYSYDMSVFVEQELMEGLGARVGYVRKDGRNNWQNVQVARLYGLFDTERTFADAGPDGSA